MRTEAKFQADQAHLRIREQVKTMNRVPPPKERLKLGAEVGTSWKLVDGPMAAIGDKRSLTDEEFIADALAKAKSDLKGAAEMLKARIAARRADAIDGAYDQHTKITAVRKERQRTIVLADFIAMCMKSRGSNIAYVGRTTRDAILEVLTDAGYTAEGRHQANALTGFKAGEVGR